MLKYLFDFVAHVGIVFTITILFFYLPTIIDWYSVKIKECFTEILNLFIVPIEYFML